MKTSELTGVALDWAVAKCEGIDHDTAVLNIKYGDDNDWFLAFSTDWAQGGPIIEREGINLSHNTFHYTRWEAWTPAPEQERGEAVALGPTPLIAAMRCYVANKMGAEVEIPAELVS